MTVFSQALVEKQAVSHTRG